MKKILTIAQLAIGSTACSQTSTLNTTALTPYVKKTVTLNVQLVDIAKSELDTLPSNLSELSAALQAAPHSSQKVVLQQGTPSEKKDLRIESYISAYNDAGTPIKKQAKDGYQFIFAPKIQPDYLYLKAEGQFDNIIDKTPSPISNVVHYRTEQYTLSSQTPLEYGKPTLISSVTMKEAQFFGVVTPTQS